MRASEELAQDCIHHPTERRRPTPYGSAGTRHCSTTRRNGAVVSGSARPSRRRRIACAHCPLRTPNNVDTACPDGRVCAQACPRTRCSWGHGRRSIATGGRSSRPTSRYPGKIQTAVSIAPPRPRPRRKSQASQTRLAPALPASLRRPRADNFGRPSGTNGSFMFVGCEEVAASYVGKTGLLLGKSLA